MDGEMQRIPRTEGCVEEVWEGEQAEGVPRGGGVEDDAAEMGIVGALGECNHLADGHRLIHPRRQRVQQLACRETNIYESST